MLLLLLMMTLAFLLLPRLLQFSVVVPRSSSEDDMPLATSAAFSEAQDRASRTYACTGESFSCCRSEAKDLAYVCRTYVSTLFLDLYYGLYVQYIRTLQWIFAVSGSLLDPTVCSK